MAQSQEFEVGRIVEDLRGLGPVEDVTVWHGAVPGRDPHTARDTVVAGDVSTIEVEAAGEDDTLFLLPVMKEHGLLIAEADASGDDVLVKLKHAQRIALAHKHGGL